MAVTSGDTDTGNTAKAFADACAREPIHVPGAVQPHGALCLIDSNDIAVQVSANLGRLLGRQQPTLPARLPDIVGAAAADEVGSWLKSGDALYSRQHRIGDGHFIVSGHRARQGAVLEFEAAGDGDLDTTAHYPLLRRFMDRTDGIADVAALCHAAAEEFIALTGFHRVMVYRFDTDWHGTVIAERGDGTLPSYLDLRFPASDIPAQARELYRINRLRLIPTATYEPVALEPALCPVDGQPLDLTFAALRSVSPVHLEYMRNMGTAASMSISIVIDDVLWGLVSCHHAQMRHVGPRVRSACDFLGRLLAQQISSNERGQDIQERLRLKRIETEMIAHLARADTFQQGLVQRAADWLRLTNSAGAAVVTDGIVLTAGATPTPEQIRELVVWLQTRRGENVIATDALATLWPPGAAMADVASGIIAVSISSIHPSYIIWCRPEVVRTVTWGGDPSGKRADSTGRLTPRLSFESWKEIVRQRAARWTEAELFSAAEFRNAVISFVLQRAEERAQLTDQLQATNKELESFSYSISHDLRAPFRHIVGYAQLLGEQEAGLQDVSRHYLDGIKTAALSAGQLVDDLLHFSQLGRAHLNKSRIDMNKIVLEIRRSMETDGARLIWEVGDLPVGWGDQALVRQALYNLIDNAVKYSRDAQVPRVRISGRALDDSLEYVVEDNGVGFDMAYAGKLFQVFQRLHRQEDFEGTGIGLALTKRIIDRHGGTLEAKGRVGHGATFSFRLPTEKR